MKPNEIRIGNMLKQGVVESITKTTAFCYIPKKGQSIFQPLCTGNHYEYDKLEPIELTEEILMKIGWDKITEWKGNIEIEKKKFDLTTDKEVNKITVGIPCTGSNDEGYTDELDIKYLHQLQNLYYAITGREL